MTRRQALEVDLEAALFLFVESVDDHLTDDARRLLSAGSLITLMRSMVAQRAADLARLLTDGDEHDG